MENRDLREVELIQRYLVLNGCTAEEAAVKIVDSMLAGRQVYMDLRMKMLEWDCGERFENLYPGRVEP